MEFRGICALISIALFVFCAQTTSAYPRDSSVMKTDEISTVTNGLVKKTQTEEVSTMTDGPVENVPCEENDNKDNSNIKEAGLGIHNYVVIDCEFEEATEDVVCQNHCLPKGYNYGLCVSHKCSCV